MENWKPHSCTNRNLNIWSGTLKNETNFISYFISIRKLFPHNKTREFKFNAFFSSVSLNKNFFQNKETLSTNENSMEQYIDFDMNYIASVEDEMEILKNSWGVFFRPSFFFSETVLRPSLQYGRKKYPKTHWNWVKLVKHFNRLYFNEKVIFFFVSCLNPVPYITQLNRAEMRWNAIK